MLQVFSKGDNFLTKQIEILNKSAKNGIVPIGTLQQEFFTNSEKILKTSLQTKQNKSLFEKVALKFSGVVHVRKLEGDEGSQKSEDIIARAGAALSSGNVEVAIQELANLDTTYKQNLNSWLIKASDYTNAQTASEAVLKYVTRPIINS